MRRTVCRWRRVLLALLILSLLALAGSKPFWRLFYPFPFQQLVRDEARRNRLDPYLVAAMMRVESHFNSKAVSHRGAVGLLQLLPLTARSLLESEADLRDRFLPGQNPASVGDQAILEILLDPGGNVALGCRYLRYLVDHFDGNLAAAVAAYNGGMGNVGTWLRSGAWSGRATELATIPYGETRRYVEAVFRLRDLYARLY